MGHCMFCCVHNQNQCVHNAFSIVDFLAHRIGGYPLVNLWWITVCSQRPEGETKDCLTARKIQKADREKLRRDRLNEQFLELGNVLGTIIVYTLFFLDFISFRYSIYHMGFGYLFGIDIIDRDVGIYNYFYCLMFVSFHYSTVHE